MCNFTKNKERISAASSSVQSIDKKMKANICINLLCEDTAK